MFLPLYFFTIILPLLNCLSPSPNSPVFFEIRDSSLPLINAPQTYFFESGCSSTMRNPTALNPENQCSSHYRNILRLSPEELSSTKKFSFSFIKKHLSNQKLKTTCPEEDSNILSIKSYWRHGGYIPKDDARKETRRANLNKDHTPDFIESLKIAGYLFFNEKVPENNRLEIKHELLGLCTVCKTKEGEKNSYHHYIIDRNANAELPDIWNTKIRLIYTGEGTNCESNDPQWAENKTKGMNVRAESFAIYKKTKYTINNLLKDIRKYLSTFPKYNALYNCQHFATNLYNKISGKKEPFISKDEMVMKERGGKTNEDKLFYKFE